MAPFSLDDLDGERSAPAAPATPAAPTQDEPTMSPFSLSDLGLSDDEIAGLESLNEAPTSAPEAPAAPPAEDEPTMSPFSLSDLGLSDDEIAGLESLNEAPTPATEAPAAPPTTPLAEDEPTMSPFSLSDLGLSDDEIASLGAPAIPAAAPPTTPLAEEEPTMSPFSLSDLGLSDDEIASLDAPAAPAAAAPSSEEEDMGMAPFSLSDLGLSDDEIAGLGSLGMGSESLPERPVSGSAAPSDTTPQPPHSTSSGSNEEAFDASDLPTDLQPFSLDELDLTTSGAGTPNIGGLGSSLQPFSFDEPPQRPRVSGFMADESFETSADEQESIPETGGFSWQEPTQKPQTSFMKSPRGAPAPEEGSIFSKLKQRQQQEGVSEPPEPPPPVSIREDEHLGLFSLDNVSLREDEGLHEPTAAQPTASMPEPPAAPPEVENLRDAIDSGQVQPFSLADLGLSEEEIAALGLGDAMLPSGAPDTPAAPESLTQRGTEPESSAEPGSTYALDDLEPVASEPVTLEPAPKPPATESDEGLPSTGDLQPFSLTDLGLTEEEIIELGLDTTSEPEEATGSELGITEEELKGLDLGDIHWNEPQATAAPAAPTPSEPPAAEELGLQTTSGDLLFDRLIALGREQGYVDISDIMAGFDDPEADAARIEELGQRLHAAHIEIRDGDEVIDMDAEYAEAEESPVYSESEPSEPAPRQDEEPVMTPFSLADLGLSEEEIASLGLTDAAPSTSPVPEPEPTAAPTQDEEPVMTPFSLADLGLSDAEIAALGMGEAPAPEAVAEEPDAAASTVAQAPVEEPPAAAAPEPAPVPPVEPVAATVPPKRPAARASAADEPPKSSSGNEMLDAYMSRLNADPENHVLRRSIARAGGQLGRADFAVQQYRYLIKQNVLLDHVVDDLQDLISDADDQQILRRLHRTLGDAYTKQGRLAEAMDEYCWTPAGS
jgi:uncharacterized protein YjiS (DUF1127 family)